MTLVRVGSYLKYQLVCEHCGRAFLGWKKSQKYCDRICGAEGRIRLLPCDTCGKGYRKTLGNDRFCSRRCSAASQWKPRPHCSVCGVEINRGSTACARHRHTRKRLARQRTCPQCQKTYIPYSSALRRGAGKYCSIDCYRIVQSARPAMLLVACAHCGTEFRRTSAAIKRVRESFCSSKCATTAHSRENSPMWRGGHDANRGPYWQKIAAEIRERDGHRCRMCGKTEAENKQRLSVDHIIPWRTFSSAEEANQPSNLVSLCRSCHTKKSGRAEARWLKGDVLDMWRYQIAVSEPWPAPTPQQRDEVTL